jgi:hypothetical protein
LCRVIHNRWPSKVHPRITKTLYKFGKHGIYLRGAEIYLHPVTGQFIFGVLMPDDKRSGLEFELNVKAIGQGLQIIASLGPRKASLITWTKSQSDYTDSAIDLRARSRPYSSDIVRHLLRLP